MNYSEDFNKFLGSTLNLIYRYAEGDMDLIYNMLFLMQMHYIICMSNNKENFLENLNNHIESFKQEEFKEFAFNNFDDLKTQAYKYMKKKGGNP